MGIIWGEGGLVGERVADRVRILVVEDEPLVAKALVAMLRGNYDVVVAQDPTSAMRDWDPKNFDAVISDYAMPGTNGITLLEWVRDASPQTARILTSGNFNPNTDGAPSELLDAFLSKPFRGADVRSAVERVLAKRRADLCAKHILDRDSFLGRLLAEFRRSARHEHELAVLRLTIEGAPGGQAWWKDLTRRLCADPRFRVRISDTLGMDARKELLVLLPETSVPGGEVKAQRMREAVRELALPDATGVSFTVTGFPRDVSSELELFDALR